MFLACECAGISTVGTAFAADSPAKPNILFILADDLGYAALGCQGSPDVKTPNIDSLAANGIRITAGYVTAPQSSPSRAGLLSGRYQQRFGHEGNPNFPVMLMGGGRTMADHLKAAGYLALHAPHSQQVDFGDYSARFPGTSKERLGVLSVMAQQDDSVGTVLAKLRELKELQRLCQALGVYDRSKGDIATVFFHNFSSGTDEAGEFGMWENGSLLPAGGIFKSFRH